MYRLITQKGSHSKLTQWMMIIFIISLGLGEVVNVAGIKLSYIATFLMILMLFSENGGRVLIGGKHKASQKFMFFCLLWVVYPVVQLIWVKDFSLWLVFYRALIINLLVIFILLIYIRTWEDWMWISFSFIAFHVIALGVGLWEMVTGQHIILLEGEKNLAHYAGVPLIFYGNGNDTAVVLCMGIANVLMFYFVKKRKIKEKIIFFLIVLLSIVEIWTINARGASYGLILMIPFIVFFYFQSGVSKKNYKMGEIILYSSIVLGLMVVFIIFTIHPIEYYFWQFSGSGNLGSDLVRLQLIVNAFRAFLDTFLFGTGPGQSIVANGINLHFFYLEILIEYGVIFGSYILFQFLKIGLKSEHSLSRGTESVLRSVPFVLILLGVSSSKTFILRPTWILFVIMYTAGEASQIRGEEQRNTRILM